jgi:hypothetical protein
MAHPQVTSGYRQGATAQGGDLPAVRFVTANGATINRRRVPMASNRTSEWIVQIVILATSVRGSGPPSLGYFPRSLAGTRPRALTPRAEAPYGPAPAGIATGREYCSGRRRIEVLTIGTSRPARWIHITSGINNSRWHRRLFAGAPERHVGDTHSPTWNRPLGLEPSWSAEPSPGRPYSCGSSRPISRGSGHEGQIRP